MKRKSDVLEDVVSSNKRGMHSNVTQISCIKRKFVDDAPASQNKRFKMNEKMEECQSIQTTFSIDEKQLEWLQTQYANYYDPDQDYVDISAYHGANKSSRYIF